jgi:hypothetical protein
MTDRSVVGVMEIFRRQCPMSLTDTLLEQLGHYQVGALCLLSAKNTRWNLRLGVANISLATYRNNKLRG